MRRYRVFGTALTLGAVGLFGPIRGSTQTKSRTKAGMSLRLVNILVITTEVLTAFISGQKCGMSAVKRHIFGINLKVAATEAAKGTILRLFVPIPIAINNRARAITKAKFVVAAGAFELASAMAHGLSWLFRSVLQARSV